MPKEVTLSLMPAYLEMAQISAPVKPLGVALLFAGASAFLTADKSILTMSASRKTGSTS